MADNQLFNEIGDEISRALKQGLKNGNFGGLDSAIRSSVNRVLDDATEHLERSIRGGGAQNVSTHKYSTYSDGAATREKQKQLVKIAAGLVYSGGQNMKIWYSRLLEEFNEQGD